jgi:hypothetical protein
MAVSGLSHPQGGRPAAVFFPFGHPTPYVYDHDQVFSKFFQKPTVYVRASHIAKFWSPSGKFSVPQLVPDQHSVKQIHENKKIFQRHRLLTSHLCILWVSQYSCINKKKKKQQFTTNPTQDASAIIQIQKIPYRWNKDI